MKWGPQKVSLEETQAEGNTQKGALIRPWVGVQADDWQAFLKASPPVYLAGPSGPLWVRPEKPTLSQIGAPGPNGPHPPPPLPPPGARMPVWLSVAFSTNHRATAAFIVPSPVPVGRHSQTRPSAPHPLGLS